MLVVAVGVVDYDDGGGSESDGWWDDVDGRLDDGVG